MSEPTGTVARRCICTYSGVQFFPLEPKPEMVKLEDIAHALGNMPRFTGHTREFYSVAQHSVMVSFVCDEPDAAYGLLHDAAEAYLVDLPTPIKAAMPDYKIAEKRLLSVIYSAFGLDPSIEKPPSVERADAFMLDAERFHLMPSTSWWPKGDSNPLEILVPQPPHVAKQLFLNRFQSILSRGQLIAPKVLH